jgi:hypothetical protein
MARQHRRVGESLQRHAIRADRVVDAIAQPRRELVGRHAELVREHLAIGREPHADRDVRARGVHTAQKNAERERTLHPSSQCTVHAAAANHVFIPRRA